MVPPALAAAPALLLGRLRRGVPVLGRELRRNQPKALRNAAPPAPCTSTSSACREGAHAEETWDGHMRQ
eukprot:15446911-Alexandrium_andersonii.AAC.1